MNRSWNIIKKVLSLSVIMIGFAISFIVLSGNQYLFFAMRNTALKGRWGPSIDEYKIYENREVKASSPQPWAFKDNQASFLAEELKYHQRYRTAAFVVVHRDSVLFEYYDKQHSEYSLTNSWSTSKSIVSLLIGIAIDQGLIKDENVLLSDYFSAYEGSGISLKHLLTMSSGINFDEHYANPLSHSAKSLYGNDIIALNYDYVPSVPPGEQFDYQGGNTILLGMVLAKVTGMSVSDYASKQLWQPLGAEQPAQWSLDHKDGMERVFCCFNATARDFARIGSLVQHNGVWKGDTLVSSSYLRRATRAADIKLEDGSPNQKYGYQWWVLNMEKYKGTYARGIQGQYIVSIPEEELVIVRLGDKRPLTRVEGHVTDMLYHIDMARRMVRSTKP